MRTQVSLLMEKIRQSISSSEGCEFSGTHAHIAQLRRAWKHSRGAVISGVGRCPWSEGHLGRLWAKTLQRPDLLSSGPQAKAFFGHGTNGFSAVFFFFFLEGGWEGPHTRERFLYNR